MRLTLRTLLAYLDDILPPAQTKEIGEKIAASPAAEQLVGRIRDVMRRRRITASEPSGEGGVDPNLVAEYLDNALAPDKVAQVEQACLASDTDLAEVAGCHQILTLVLGEPVDVTAALRERMYALGPAAAAVEGFEPPPPSKHVRETNAREQLAAIKGAGRAKPVPPAVAPASVESRLPDYLQRRAWYKQPLPYIVAGLLAAWLGLLYYDPSLFPGGGRKEVAVEPNPKPAADAKARPAEALEPDAAEAAAVAALAAETTTPAATVAAAELPVDPAPPAVALPVTEPADAAMPGGAKPSAAGMKPPADAVASAADARPPAVVPNPMPPMPSDAMPPDGMPPGGGAAPSIEIVTRTGPLLRSDATGGVWTTLTPEAMKTDGPIAAPEPYQATVRLGGLPVRMTLLGGTRITTFGRTDAADAGVDVRQGRIRLSADPDAGDAPRRFAVRLGDALWRVELDSPDAACGLEAIPLQPTAPNQDIRGRTPVGVIYVVSGAVRVADGAGRVRFAPAGGRLELASADVAVPAAAPAATEETPADAVAPAVAEPPAGAAGLPALGLPDWVTPREPTSAMRSMMVNFQKEIPDGRPVSQSLLPIVSSTTPHIAELAVKCLGLIESTPGLVKALRDSDDEPTILAAGDALRNWLGRDPSHGAQLSEELAVVLPQAEAQVVERLLWGYSEADARDKATALQLVDWLDHKGLAVRELAFSYVKRFSGRTMNYRPQQTEAQRAGGIARWRSFVEQHGGLTLGEGN